MHDDYKYVLLKFAATHIASNTDIQNCRENIFDIQEIYSNSKPDGENVFCPISFFAAHIDEILKLEGIIIEFDKYSKVPRKISYNELTLFINYKMNNLHLTILYLRFFDRFYSKFNSKAYYAQYHELIESKYQTSKLKTFDLASLFYVEYGYWNNLLLNYIHPYQFKCSYPEFTEYDENDILKKIFEFNEDHLKLVFDPYVYISSNIEQLSYLLDNETSIPNYNNELRIYKQYLRDYHTKKLKTSSFDIYDYLANNSEQIEKIMTIDNVIYWDIYRLSKRNVCLNFLQNYKTSKSNNFDSAKFVEENVNDKSINYDKKLSIETAPRYFVINYVKSKKLRYHMSKRYRLGVFFSQRIKDSLRTLPLSVTKCFYTFPI